MTDPEKPNDSQASMQQDAGQTQVQPIIQPNDQVQSAAQQDGNPTSARPASAQPAQQPVQSGTQPYASFNQPTAQQSYAYSQPFPQPTQQPYGQAGAYGNGQQPPAPSQPPYPYAQAPVQQPCPPAQQPRKKVWPWVVGGCLLAVLLVAGGFAAGVAFSLISGLVAEESEPEGIYYFDDSDGLYGYQDDSDGLYGDSSSDGYSSSSGAYTKDEIESIVEESYGTLDGTIDNGSCAPGIYEVGAGKDIEPGLYYLEGSQTEESNYLVFEQEDGDGLYELDDSVVYFGNYYTQLEEGDLIVFAAPEEARMYLASQANVEVEAPYQSGVYRVGTDIPAGTYTVTIQSDAAAATDYDAGVYVMEDLEFDDDSIVETKYVIAGGSQTITVTEGQYVELFAAVMEPAA